MVERDLREWEKSIKVLFENFPQLKNIIKNPVYYSNSPWAREMNNYFINSTGGSTEENFYRVVFKQGSPKSLMTIGSGELSGLKTTCIVEKGRIAAVAGLERVDIPAPNLLPMLLTMGMFGAIQNRLSYISDICTDIRNRQIVGDHARLERISEVILDCFESIPEMNQGMMHLNLSRIVSNTDECLELLYVMKAELARDSQAKNHPYSTFDGRNAETWSDNSQRYSYSPSYYMKQMMQHSVFAVYERFIAGKICQIVLSGNYSTSNIERCKQSVIRVCDSIRQIFTPRIQAHKNGVLELKQKITELENDFRNGYISENNRPGETYVDLENLIINQSKTISEIELNLHHLLEAKIESFDFLLQLANENEIDVYLINGSICIEKKEIQENFESVGAISQ